MNNYSNNPKCSVLVSSCDAYSDAWEPFFTLFFRYWPDCPFPVFLISNRQHYNNPRVTTILTEDDKKWATNMKIALNTVLTPYLIYMQEDYFLRSFVDTDYVNKLIDYADKEKVACIKFYPEPSSDLFLKNDLGLSKISPKAQNRISLQAALWNRGILSNIIKDGESGWDMEARGGNRSGDHLFLSASNFVLDYLPQTGIVKGKWMVGAIKLCRREGIKLDLSRRPIAYDIEWRYFLDRLRKKRFMRILKQLPVIGDTLTRVLNFLRSIGVKKSLN